METELAMKEATLMAQLGDVHPLQAMDSWLGGGAKLSHALTMSRAGDHDRSEMESRRYHRASAHSFSPTTN